MKAVSQYKPVIEKWEQAPFETFTGPLEVDISYNLGIIPKMANEPEHILFNVWVIHTIKKGEIELFYSKTYYCYKVEHNNEIPTIDFYFQLMEVSTQQDAAAFGGKYITTPLQNHKIPRPVLTQWAKAIQHVIDHWKKTAQDNFLS